MEVRRNRLSIIIALACACVQLSSGAHLWGGLYPKDSPFREVKSLDGVWNFRRAPLHNPDEGFHEKWFSQPLRKTGPVISMPVPSSYNDITQDKSIRDHIGWAWYDRKFYVPTRWKLDNLRVFIRFGSAHYYSIIYLNGVELASHEGGHLPIRGEITDQLNYGEENLLTVAINNVLTPETIPEGQIIYHNDTRRYPPGYFIQSYAFDFFNYAGIHRPVYVYTTPATFIDDIDINTDVDGIDGTVSYNISVGAKEPSTGERADAPQCSIKILNKELEVVASSSECQDSVRIQNATLWWPYLMSEDPGYLYTLQVSLSDGNENYDQYAQKFGIRTVAWNSTTLMINGAPVYLHGVGRHEDWNVRGKGLDHALVVKDFNLMKWLGVNVFRTSHYPYAEEIMDMADQEGIMVVDECPAVSLSNFGLQHLETHKSMMNEMMRRDKNRPSVIMWSVANEPKSFEPMADLYFKDLTDATKEADSSRPVTAAINIEKYVDLLAKHLDVIMVNRYYSWYEDAGHLELIENQTITEFTGWHQLHNKPVMISEYGAGTVIGLHQSPESLWAEEYQSALVQENFKAFDILRRKGFFFGEMIWNFADFATAQGTGRVGGNRKGVLTRNRQPKQAAHLLRQRYHSLENVKVENVFGDLAKSHC